MGVPLRRQFAVLATTALAACGGDSTAPEATPCEKAVSLRGGNAEFTTVANEAAIASQVVPGGFGGLYQDLRTNKLVIFLKDLSRADDSKDALLQVLGCGGAYPGWLGSVISLDQIEIRQGRYTGLELHTYLNALDALRSDPEVWGLELDPELQQIWMGTSSQAAAARVQLAAAAVAVPLDALRIESPPASNGPQAFEVLTTPVVVTEGEPEGLFGFSLSIEYTNFSSGTRYPDQCATPGPPHFKGNLERWNGTSWVLAHEPICGAILLEPRPIGSGESAVDQFQVTAARLLDVLPRWYTARVTGTYRFVGAVYRATIPEPIFVTDLAPLSERTSAPFRIVRTAPLQTLAGQDK